ncbi:transient receptor potential cation channel subfamily V member 5 isoform X5 [Diachasmimorpha longicaudata]|uniref:transient receptor potential cation channel subfamily V member 5 isoform X5 n=1 Tax=Diachasmimorpha longicaudata TaxID=58733 RepID=UPI0030B9005C
MGNTESNVTSGVKKQTDTSSILLYKLVDLKGGGLLVDMMKRATQTKQYAELDHAIRTKVEPFLYNKGKGKWIPISKLVLLRNKERPRHKMLPVLKAMENPSDYDVDVDMKDEVIDETKIDKNKYRLVCWNLSDRGAVGETILHLCMLNATALHADLAKRLLRFYPNLINDVYLSDEYYGESVLHIAIVNEDPAMVKYLLDSGADVHERCFGNFMCPEDQKASRTDSLDHEWPCVTPETNYDGYVYWGEYPLNFAACLGQEECYRLVLARGADPDKQDTNGNTVLHMLVIYSKVETEEHLELMDGVLVDLLNAKWNTFIKSRFYQQFFLFCFYFVLSLISFVLRPGPSPSNSSRNSTKPTSSSDMSSSAFPPATSASADGTLGALGKSQEFGQLSRVVRQLATTLANNFMASVNVTPANVENFITKISDNFTLTLKDAFNSDLVDNSGLNVFEGKKNESVHEQVTPSAFIMDSALDEEWWEDLTEVCRLMQLDSSTAKIRLTAEIFMEFGAMLYILAALREARFLGLNMFIENLMTAPSRVMFLFSCCILMSFPFLRLACADKVEDMLAVVVMLTTAPYFLFFCRGFKTVGPFVVMIYRMIMGDLLRFVTIYLVFVMGFSQAYYIIFLSFDNPQTPEGVDDTTSNPMPSPMESIMAMFLMSMTNFGDYYGAFERTEHEMEAKCLFVVYMAIVAILLVNMLIAMMGNTYQKIAETRNEWQRQWARIVLVVERGVAPAERLKKLMDYSQPMSDGRRALVLRLHQSEEDKEDMKEILEMKRTHERLYKKRMARMKKEGDDGIVESVK